MRVTEDMKTDGGAPLSKLADFIGTNGKAIHVTEEIHEVRIEANSTSTCNVAVWLTPDDADALADLIKLRAQQARGVTL